MHIYVLFRHHKNQLSKLVKSVQFNQFNFHVRESPNLRFQNLYLESVISVYESLSILAFLTYMSSRAQKMRINRYQIRKLKIAVIKNQ